MEVVGQFFFDVLVILVKIFSFVHQALTQESSSTDLAVSLIVLLFFFALIYGLLFEALHFCLIFIPFLAKNPPFYPSSSKYLVRFASHDSPIAFRWQYPYLLVDGAKYNMRMAHPQKGEPPVIILATGTVIEFIPL